MLFAICSNLDQSEILSYCNGLKNESESSIITHDVELNGVLCPFQQYFSHITATDHIIHVFPGFHQY